LGNLLGAFMKNEITGAVAQDQEKTLIWLEHYRKTLHEINNADDINSGDFTYIQPRPEYC
jgi:hypothetical protein